MRSLREANLLTKRELLKASVKPPLDGVRTAMMVTNAEGLQPCLISYRMGRCCKNGKFASFYFTSWKTVIVQRGQLEMSLMHGVRPLHLNLPRLYDSRNSELDASVSRIEMDAVC